MLTLWLFKEKKNAVKVVLLMVHFAWHLTSVMPSFLPRKFTAIRYLLRAARMC